MDVPVTETDPAIADLVRRVEAGEEVVQTRDGMPVARVCRCDRHRPIGPVGAPAAHAAADAHDRWGRSMHPAGLNFGDCFAYALAKARGWPLLFVGDDFARTDLAPAISA